MNPKLAVPHRLFRLLAMLWVGSLLTIGYAAAPVLFTTLDRASAGNVAAQLFRIEGWIGAVCGVMLLALANGLIRRGEPVWRQPRRLVAGMLACVLLGYFALEPFMNALRVAAQAAGTDVGHSAYAVRFGWLHGAATVFYGVESVLALVLVWTLPAGAGTAAAAQAPHDPAGGRMLG